MLTNYESMIIVNPQFSEEEADAENEKVLAFIREKQGTIMKTDRWGKRQLAYEIVRHREGWYYINYFTMENAHIPELERFYKLNESIIRNNLLHLSTQE